MRSMNIAAVLAAIAWTALYVSNYAIHVGSEVYGDTLRCTYFTGTGTVAAEYWTSLRKACPRWYSLK